MGTLYDYLKWRGDISFEEVPVNDVDSLIFSQLSYIDYKWIVPPAHQGSSIPIQAAANSFFAKHPNPKDIYMGVLLPKGLITLLKAVKDTRRFRNVEMRAYVNVIDTKKETQFSATTFLINPNSMMIAYRGTDDTLVGWKEDLNMSFLPVVPAQRYAAQYLNEAAQNFSGEIRITGHSKGGNLAVYAAVHSNPSVKKMIKRVWCLDGPGFNQGFLHSAEYLKLRPLIRSFVPQAAFVGILLDHEDNYTVVKSRQTGVFQHDALSWSVLGSSLVTVKETTKRSQRNDQNLNNWIGQMTPKQREQFVEALYQIFSSDNATTLTDLVSFRKNKWLQKSAGLDPHVKKTVLRTLALYMESQKGGLLSSVFKKKEP
ncbi:MAG: DUF2974 domain-containing protein [Clostridia bacterium]|nr:DUF2974 domain-containing protein [Clostridia bacterium]